MNHFTPQVSIVKDKGRAMAVLPLKDYRRLLAMVEKKHDEDALRQAEAIMARVKAGRESLIPAAVVDAILDGTHPVRAWRHYRQMTAEALATKAGIARAYLTQIENNKRRGTLPTLKALAKILGTGVDALTD